MDLTYADRVTTTARSRAYQLSLLHLCVVLLAVGITGFFYFKPGFLYGSLNSDTLLPVSFVWDLLHIPGGWRHHELARIPSLLPDIGLMLALFVATGSVVWTHFLYSVLQIIGLSYAAGWLVRQATGVAIARAAAVMAAALTILALAGYLDVLKHTLSITQPVIHVGPFVLALVGVSAAATLRERWSVAAGALLFLAASNCLLSDKLLFVSFAIPVIVAVVVPWPGVAAAARVGLVFGCGLLCGWLLLTALRHAGLRVADGNGLNPAGFGQSIRGFFHDLPYFFVWSKACLTASAVIAAVTTWFAVRDRLSIRYGQTGQILRTALLSCGCLIGFTVLVYQDWGSDRYLVAVFLWVAVLSALVLSPHRWAPQASAMGALAIIVAAPIIRGVPLRYPVLDSVTAACLRTWHDRLNLHAGLADYWHARQTEIALGWKVQVDQLLESGGVQLWQSDPYWYVRDIHAPERKPVYDFIVTDHLSEDGLIAHYGRPTQVVPCDAIKLWVYQGQDLEPMVVKTLPASAIAHP